MKKLLIALMLTIGLSACEFSLAKNCDWVENMAAGVFENSIYGKPSDRVIGSWDQEINGMNLATKKKRLLMLTMRTVVTAAFSNKTMITHQDDWGRYVRKQCDSYGGLDNWALTGYRGLKL